MHLWIYKVFNGEFEKGLIVRHKCNNVWCVNPNHLIIGTRKDNEFDKIEAGTYGKKLSKEQVVEIKKLLKRKKKVSDIAKMFNVHEISIYDIKNGVTWKMI